MMYQPSISVNQTMCRNVQTSSGTLFDSVPFPLSAVLLASANIITLTFIQLSAILRFKKKSSFINWFRCNAIIKMNSWQCISSAVHNFSTRVHSWKSISIMQPQFKRIDSFMFISSSISFLFNNPPKYYMQNTWSGDGKDGLWKAFWFVSW